MFLFVLLNTLIISFIFGEETKIEISATCEEIDQKVEDINSKYCKRYFCYC